MAVLLLLTQLVTAAHLSPGDAQPSEAGFKFRCFSGSDYVQREL